MKQSFMYVQLLIKSGQMSDHCKHIMSSLITASQSL